MTEADNAVLVEMTTEVVAAYVAKNHVQTSDMPTLISTVHASLAGLGAPAPAAVETEKLTPAVPIKKSITDGYLVCLDDGKHFSSPKRYLAVLGSILPLGTQVTVTPPAPAPSKTTGKTIRLYN